MSLLLFSKHDSGGMVRSHCRVDTPQHTQCCKPLQCVRPRFTEFRFDLAFILETFQSDFWLSQRFGFKENVLPAVELVGIPLKSCLVKVAVGLGLSSKFNFIYSAD